MNLIRRRHMSLAATVAAMTTIGLVGGPATATINIPDGGTVQRDSVSVITFRVLDGCEGASTDAIEVTIPENVSNVQPEAVPGWVLEYVLDDGERVSAIGEADPDRSITAVSWSGGVLPDSTFGDFGMRAQFPDEETLIRFPVVQRCGEISLEWDGDGDSERPAPAVAVGPDVNAREEVEFAQAVEDLQADVAALGEDLAALQELVARNQDELSGVNLDNLRGRVSDVEDRVSALEGSEGS